MKQNPFILYIEDERPTLDLVCQVLKISGYSNIQGVTCGQEGLRLMRAHKPDLLLLDLMMPDVSGWEVYQAVKTDGALADIPVIVITAKIPNQGRVIIDGLPPADDYITKPFDMKRLLQTLQNLLPDV
jgi:CheY-like chemotaxis protein